LRFAEPDRASKFFLAIILHSYCLGMLVAEPLKDENRVTRRAPLFRPERVLLDLDTNHQGCALRRVFRSKVKS
jgi:hypothetical protein